MANVVRAEAVITAQDKMRPGLISAARQLEAFRRNQSRAAPLLAAKQMLDQQAELLRRGAALAAGYMGAQNAKQSVVRAADVDRQMRRAAITGDAVEGRIAGATAEVRTIALDTAQPLDKVRSGLDKLVAAGMEFETSMKALPSVAKTAQASGAEVADIAESATALVDNFDFDVSGLNGAYDILAKMGKLGKFELKDMARYLPSILPSAKAIGMGGEKGLAHLGAMLQVIRSGTGIASEAADSMRNIFQKMETEATVKNFDEMGVNLPKAMARARKEGKELLEVFLDLSEKALKGDMSKAPQLFSDAEVLRGMRPLLDQRDKIRLLREEAAKSAGTIDADFNRVIKDTQASVDRLGESFDRSKTAVGGFLATLMAGQIQTATDALQKFGETLEKATEAGKAGGARAALEGYFAPIIEDAQLASRVFAERERRQQAEGAKKRLRQLDDEIASYASAPTPAVAKNPAAMEMRQRRLAALKAERDQLRGAYSDMLSAALLDENPVPEAGAAEDGALRTMREDALEQLRERMRAEALRFKDKTKGGKPEIPLPPVRPRDLNGAMPEAPVADFGEERPPDAPRGPDATAMAATAERVAAAWQLTGSKIAAAMEPASAAVDRVRESAGQALPSLALPPPDLGPWMGAGGEIAAGLKPAETGVEQIKASVNGLGPAGQSAGSHLSQGLVSGILAAEAQVSASVERMQAKLNSLKAPSLGGVGGFNTGRAMPEIR